MSKPKTSIGRLIRLYRESSENFPMIVLFCPSCGEAIDCGIMRDIQRLIESQERTRDSPCPSCETVMTKLAIFPGAVMLFTRELILPEQFFN